MATSKIPDILQFLRHPPESHPVSLNGNCPISHNSKIADVVRQSVADLNSLLGLVVTMRNGLDDMPPRSHDEIAVILNESLPQSLKSEIAVKSSLKPEEFEITGDVVKGLEVAAYRSLSGR